MTGTTVVKAHTHGKILTKNERNSNGKNGEGNHHLTLKQLITNYNMQKLFENWRQFIVESKQKVEFFGVMSSGERAVYLIDDIPYYVSAGTGGKARSGDLVQFGGVVNTWKHKPSGATMSPRDARAVVLNRVMGRLAWSYDHETNTSSGKFDPDIPPIDTSTPEGRKLAATAEEIVDKEFKTSRWVVKNPTHKRSGLINAAEAVNIRDLAAETAAIEARNLPRTPEGINRRADVKLYSDAEINYVLNERGAINYDWIKAHDLEGVEIPGVTPPYGLRLKTKPSRKGRGRSKPSNKKQINKELKAIAELPPENTFKKLIVKYGTKLPIIGRFLKVAFATTIGTMILLETEEAYAKEGITGALKVIASNAADFTPFVGDVKGAAELIHMLATEVDWEAPEWIKKTAAVKPGDPGWYSVGSKLEENKLLFENWRKFTKLNEKRYIIPVDPKDPAKGTVETEVEPNINPWFYTSAEVNDLYEKGYRLIGPAKTGPGVFATAVERLKAFESAGPIYKKGPSAARLIPPRRGREPEIRSSRLDIEDPPEKKLMELPYNHPRRVKARAEYCKKYPEKCNRKSKEDPEAVPTKGWCEPCIDAHVSQILTSGLVTRILGPIDTQRLETAIQDGSVNTWIDMIKTAMGPEDIGAVPSHRGRKNYQHLGGPGIYGINNRGERVDVQHRLRYGGPSILRSFALLRDLPDLEARLMAYERYADGTGYRKVHGDADGGRLKKAELAWRKKYEISPHWALGGGVVDD